jgi:hypothetical protein
MKKLHEQRKWRSDPDGEDILIFGKFDPFQAGAETNFYNCKYTLDYESFLNNVNEQ